MTAVTPSRQPHILVIGNNGTPTDRRVWLECTALRAAGYAVSVVSPGTSDEPPTERLEGIDVYRYRAPTRAGGFTRFAVSFAASWFAACRLAWRVWRRRRFDIVQACNPPDTYFLIAALFRPFGVRFLFDQHDVCPEIYDDRFDRPSRVVRAALVALERWTHHFADHVITVNESCRDLLLARTGTPPDRLTIVRTGADTARLRRVPPDPALRHGRRFLCSYLGIMGPQDGVDLVLHAVHHIVHNLHRDDIHFVLMGDGQCLPELKALAHKLDLEPWVDFTGWADDATISAVLSSSDIGLQPDRRTAFTDLCTMLKTIEYLAFDLPVVSFDLAESRRVAADAGVFVAEETAAAYAEAVTMLIDDPARREQMSAAASRIAATELSWDRQRPAYLAVVRGLTSQARPSRATAPRSTPRVLEPPSAPPAATKPTRRPSATPGRFRMSSDIDIAVVGAGPYGLAAAAHLRAAGRQVRVFGEPLEFWRTQTPIGMWLRSPYHGSNIGDPRSEFTLQHYERETSPVTRPIPVERFVDYGMWFAKHVVPDIDRCNVRWVARTESGFSVETDSSSVRARRVVVAAGVGTFAYVPDELRGLDAELCSHTLSHHNLSHLAGKRVSIVGGGQSALETAALLHELGAEVDVIVRAPYVRWLTESSWKHRSRIAAPLLYAKPDVGPALASHLVAHPRLYTLMPFDAQLKLARRSVRPAGAGWLRDRLDGVPLQLDMTVSGADESGDRVKLTRSDGTVELVDHVVVATGYRVDLTKYRFLDPALERTIARDRDGYPTLTAACETSVPGLHVIGAPAARRHGPLMRFVAGSNFAAHAVTRGVRG